MQVNSFGEIIFVVDLCPKIGSNLCYSKTLQNKDTYVCTFAAVFCPWKENSYSGRKMFDFCIGDTIKSHVSWIDTTL